MTWNHSFIRSTLTLFLALTVLASTATTHERRSASTINDIRPRERYDSKYFDDDLPIKRGMTVKTRNPSDREKKFRDKASDLFSSNSPRKACGFYVWNIVSAGLHNVCVHLLRDCRYEGRGGREFVLIPPGSLLQLLYPCDQYSPDACLWCGGNYRDHMTLAWSKRYLYTQFDLLVDRVTKDATSTEMIKVWKELPPDIKTTFGFHKRYVVDVNTVTKNARSKKEKDRLLREAVQKRYGNRVKEVATKSLFGVRYVFPRSLSSPFTRFLVLARLNRLVEIQEYENAIIDLRQHGEYTRRRAMRIKERLERQRGKE